MRLTTVRSRAGKRKIVRRLILVIFLTAVIGATACTSEPSGSPLSVEDAWARPTAVVGGNSAVYLRLINAGSEADILLAVDSPLAVAEVHQTVMKANDVMGMEPVGSVEIPAKDEVIFKPSGLHIMLIGLEQPLVVGDLLPLTLHFEHGDSMVLEITVQEQ